MTSACPRSVCVVSGLRGPGFGDVLQRNLLLRLVRSTCSRARVTLVVPSPVHERFSDLLEHLLADDVMVCPPDLDAASGDAFRARLAAAGHDLALVDPDSVVVGAHDVAAAGIPRRVGMVTGCTADKYLTEPATVRASLFRWPDLYDHIAGLGTALGRSAPPPPDEVVPRLEYRRLPVPAAAGPIVAVHPTGAAHWNRRWPLARYEDLCARLAELAPGVTLFLLGGRDDTAELARLARAGSPLPAHVLTDDGVDVLASWIDAATVLVGNDSGPAHLAAALGTPTVVLYGPTGTEFLWTRIYADHHGVSRPRDCCRLRHVEPAPSIVPCAFRCTRRYVGPDGSYPRCMRDIAVDDVLRAVLRRLPARPLDEEGPDD